jgi:hypothetical protein
MKRSLLLVLVLLASLIGTSLISAQGRQEDIPSCSPAELTTTTNTILIYRGAFDQVSAGIQNAKQPSDFKELIVLVDDYQTRWLDQDEPNIPRCVPAIDVAHNMTRIFDEMLIGLFWASLGEYDKGQAHMSRLEDLISVVSELEAASGVNTPTPLPLTPTVATAEGVTVTASNTVNLRGGPGTSYPITGSLAGGQTTRAKGQNNNWLYLGNDQWVAAWVVTVTGEVNTLPMQPAPPLPTSSTSGSSGGNTGGDGGGGVQPVQPTLPPAPAFVCNCSKTCPQMASCEEAYFQLQQCGCTKRDGDSDGVPCEDICPGG